MQSKAEHIRDGKRRVLPPQSLPHDLRGNRYDMLVAIEMAETRTSQSGNRKIYWKCRCDCGVVKEFAANHLTQHKATNCGCQRRIRQSMGLRKHGGSGTLSAPMMPEYRIWLAMKERCSNPNSRGWSRYGQRGISVCSRWAEDFNAFLEDMGNKPTKDHSIERIDNDGNYEPSNCGWVTRVEQANNRRSNRWVTALGRCMTLAQWSRETGIKTATIAARLNHGWAADRAVSHATRGNR